MAIDQNNGLTSSAQGIPTERPMTEQQIRTMRGDLNPMPSEPQLSVPAAPGNTTKVVFDGDEPSFSPNTVNQMPASVDALIAGHERKKTLWWVIGGVVIVVALGAVGYFVIYPMLTAAPAEPAPATELPVTPQPVTPAQPETPEKSSAFINDPGSVATITISDPISRTGIVTGITKAASTAPAGVTELLINGSGNNPLPFGPFLAAVATGFTEAGSANLLFNDDFTAFMYKDENGVWPGYVATLKPGFDPQALKGWFTSLEKAPVKNFFTGDPGKMAAFKDGLINNKYPDRYATGASAGASFGYVMLPQQQKVVISTSFAGLKEALRLMGL